MATVVPSMDTVVPLTGVRRRQVEDTDELDAILGGLGDADVAIVQFAAVWCKKCHSVAEELKVKLGDTYKIVWATVDVDELPEIASRFNVKAMPRVDVYTHGRLHASLEALDFSADAVLKALSDGSAARPTLELEADF